jgi:hypothetical protein
VTSRPLTLVVLAAGLGSRYGGLKQLEAVGPSGETLMDYAFFDAARAGFAAAVVVLRPGMEREFRAPLDVRVARQELPAGRSKPLGTTHAVLAAREEVRGSFCVVNADDFYGRSAYEAVAGSLRGTPDWVLAGYRLADTLSAAGGVNRAVCRVDAEGCLTGLEEVTAIVRRQSQIVGRAGGCQAWLDQDDLVSMNMWGFTHGGFEVLGARFGEFLARGPGPAEESLLPTAVGEAIQAGAARVRVVPARSRWIGMTHQDDRPRVMAELRRLVEAGEYPSPLWSGAA